MEKFNINRSVIEKLNLDSNKISLPIVRDVEMNDVKTNAKLDANKTLISSRYQSNGITYRSNDPAVIQRDDAGNIVLLEGEQNQIIRIEPVSTNITTISMLKVLDTQFTYYKFPTTYPIETTLDLGLDVDLELDILDIVYARYKPSSDYRLPQTGPVTTIFEPLDTIGIGNQLPASPFPELRGIITSPGPADAIGILIDEVVEGVAQTNTNAYYISKELKDSGADLRFRARITHTFECRDYTPEQISSRTTLAIAAGVSVSQYLSGYIPKSNVLFYVSKQGPNTPFNPAEYGPFFTNSANPLYSADSGSITPNEVQDTYIDIIIPNETFEAGDWFGISQTNTEGHQRENEIDPIYHTVIGEQTYWSITDASKDVDEWNRELNTDTLEN